MKEKRRNKENSIKTNMAITSIAVGIGFLIIFIILLVLVKTGSASLIDDPIRKAVIGVRSDWLTPIMKAITYMGNWQTITVNCIILLLFRNTRLAYGVPLSIGSLFVSLANKGIKALVLRPRPDEAMFLIEQGGWSFPSGHAITSMFFFGMLIWLIRRNVVNLRLANILTALFAIPMILIGVSRVYLGVHYPTDVLAGWSLGLLIIIVMSTIIKRTHR